MFGAFILLTLVFVVSLIVRRYTRYKFCSICAAVSLSWIILLTLYKASSYTNGLLIGILIGQSITGLHYWGQKRLPRSLRLFTLPYFLTATAVAYFVISGSFVWPAYGLLTVLWVAAWLIFSYRNDPGKKAVADAVIDCCEDR